MAIKKTRKRQPTLVKLDKDISDWIVYRIKPPVKNAIAWKCYIERFFSYQPLTDSIKDKHKAVLNKLMAERDKKSNHKVGKRVFINKIESHTHRHGA